MNQKFLFGSPEALDRAAAGLAESIVTGLSPAVSEALADPMVRALMTADRVDRPGLEQLLRTATAKLKIRAEARCDRSPPRFCRAGQA